MQTRNESLLQITALFEGNESTALKWCEEPNKVLQWKTPSEMMDSDKGVMMVTRLILRIEHGVYS
ncbi:antitoxin Xre/MbcA/ParS toxin-binding domain-containing protein [Scandinavium sp. M-37]|uniref:antitoxin Xre/MbcA/ParS toxin-binding domain-containing protein n=1 Tax=Scandinavium sp. M-37 TaxID=3373077 RepID=UPI003746C2DB